jgi:hypothetical protein
MLDAADLDSDEAHHQLFELQRKKIALGVEAHLGAAIKTLLLHPKKGDFILFVTKNLQDQLLDSELEGVTDVVQLSILLQTLLIEASINSPTKSFACTTVYIDESEHAVSITEHLFSEVSSFSDNKVEQIANEVATSEVIEIENSSNMKFYVLGIVITFLVSFGVIVLLGGSKKSIENKLITTMRLEELLDAKMSEQLLYSKNDTLLISFQGKTHEIYVSDGKVITPKEKANLSTKITVKKEGEEVEVKTKKESKEEDKKAIEGIKEEKVKKEEDTKENKAEEKQEKDPIKALKKNNYVHTVEKGEGFTFITKKYSKSHPNLTQKKLIEFNLKSDKFVGSKKELEKGNLQIGMELEIPKE